MGTSNQLYHCWWNIPISFFSMSRLWVTRKVLPRIAIIKGSHEDSYTQLSRSQASFNQIEQRTLSRFARSHIGKPEAKKNSGKHPAQNWGLPCFQPLSSKVGCIIPFDQSQLHSVLYERDHELFIEILYIQKKPCEMLVPWQFHRVLFCEEHRLQS